MIIAGSFGSKVAVEVLYKELTLGFPQSATRISVEITVNLTS